MGFMNYDTPATPAVETPMPVVVKKEVVSPEELVSQGFKEGKEEVDMAPLLEEADKSLYENELKEDVQKVFKHLLNKYKAINTETIKDMFIGYFDSVAEDTKIDLIAQMEKDII